MAFFGKVVVIFRIIQVIKFKASEYATSSNSRTS